MLIISFFFWRFFMYSRGQLYSLFPVQTAKRYLCSELFEWIQTWSKLKPICNYIKNYSMRISVTEHELQSKLEKQPSQSSENNTQYWISMRQLSISAIISEKAMAPHSSVLAWRIPGTGEPGGLPSMGSHRVGHDRSDLAAAAIIYLICHAKSKIMTAILTMFLHLTNDTIITSDVHQDNVLPCIFSHYKTKPTGCNSWALALWSPCSTTREAQSPQLEKAHMVQRGPSTAKIINKQNLYSLMVQSWSEARVFF